MQLEAIFYVSLAFILGGILKGGTGVGAPFIAVPVMVMMFDAQFAVASFVMPNIVTNIVQFFQTRKDIVSMPLLFLFGCAGAVGAGVGSVILVWTSQQTLSLTIAALIMVFVCWRLLRPQWQMSMRHGVIGALPAGFIAGILQGAAGISAPVSVSYLSLLKLQRQAFIATISFFFLAMGLVQLPVLIQLGVMSSDRFLFSCFAILPLLAGMPIGAALGRLATPDHFNRILLVILTCLALRLAFFALN